jgi:hypothetical protein
MPSTWPEHILPLQVRWYQISTYVALTLVDDPAWLALVFCG